jgi:hypothetical protein
MSVLTREEFLRLVGSLRCNGSFPDAPFLAFYDTVTAQLAQVTAERDELKRQELDPIGYVRELRYLLAKARARVKELEADALS